MRKKYYKQIKVLSNILLSMVLIVALIAAPVSAMALDSTWTNVGSARYTGSVLARQTNSPVYFAHYVVVSGLRVDTVTITGSFISYGGGNVNINYQGFNGATWVNLGGTSLGLSGTLIGVNHPVSITLYNTGGYTEIRGSLSFSSGSHDATFTHVTEYNLQAVISTHAFDQLISDIVIQTLAKAETTRVQTIHGGKSAALWAAETNGQVDIVKAIVEADNIPPVLTARWQNGATITDSSRNATIVATATDKSGLTTLHFSTNHGSTWTTFTSPRTITLPSTPKYQEVWIKAADSAGNETIKIQSIFVQ